jgi:hypothetical protein
LDFTRYQNLGDTENQRGEIEEPFTSLGVGWHHSFSARAGWPDDVPANSAIHWISPGGREVRWTWNAAENRWVPDKGVLDQFCQNRNGWCNPVVECQGYTGYFEWCVVRPNGTALFFESWDMEIPGGCPRCTEGLGCNTSCDCENGSDRGGRLVAVRDVNNQGYDVIYDRIATCNHRIQRVQHQTGPRLVFSYPDGTTHRPSTLSVDGDGDGTVDTQAAAFTYRTMTDSGLTYQVLDRVNYGPAGADGYVRYRYTNPIGAEPPHATEVILQKSVPCTPPTDGSGAQACERVYESMTHMNGPADGRVAREAKGPGGHFGFRYDPTNSRSTVFDLKYEQATPASCNTDTDCQGPAACPDGDCYCWVYPGDPAKNRCYRGWQVEYDAANISRPKKIINGCPGCGGFEERSWETVGEVVRLKWELDPFGYRTTYCYDSTG